jgi:YD repeat-containing protein
VVWGHEPPGAEGMPGPTRLTVAVSSAALPGGPCAPQAKTTDHRSKAKLPPQRVHAVVGKHHVASYSAPVSLFARAYRQLVALAGALLCLLAPSYVHAALSHRATFPFPDRAEHAAQQDLSSTPAGPHLTSNPNSTRRVGARDGGKAAAARRWVGAPPGRELNYKYTPGGQVEQITYPDGSNRRFEYSWTKFLLREFTHDTESEFLRDSVGRITQARITSRSETHAISYERDEFGRVTAEIQQGKRITYERDAQGRVTKRTLPNGATTTYEFATDGSLDRLNHDGYTLELTRDKLGREVQRAGSGGANIVSAYDELDRLTARAAGPLGATTPTARSTQPSTSSPAPRTANTSPVAQTPSGAWEHGTWGRQRRHAAGLGHHHAGVTRCTSTTPRGGCSSHVSSG